VRQPHSVAARSSRPLALAAALRKDSAEAYAPALLHDFGARTCSTNNRGHPAGITGREALWKSFTWSLRPPPGRVRFFLVLVSQTGPASNSPRLLPHARPARPRRPNSPWALVSCFIVRGAPSYPLWSVPATAGCREDRKRRDPFFAPPTKNEAKSCPGFLAHRSFRAALPRPLFLTSCSVIQTGVRPRGVAQATSVHGRSPRLVQPSPRRNAGFRMVASLGSVNFGISVRVYPLSSCFQRG